MTIGIYRLDFKSGGFYIGQSINIEKRFKEHIISLRTNKKANEYMMIEYQYCGEPTLSIIEECKHKELNEKEDYYIDKLNATEYPGLNVLKTSGSAQVGEDNPNAKYSNEIYVLAMYELIHSDNADKSIKQLADKLCISYSVLKSISSGKKHRWLEEKYPNEYSQMLSRNTSRYFTVRPILQDPNGKLYDLSGKSIREFCTHHNLNQGALTNVLNRKASSHKGWKLND